MFARLFAERARRKRNHLETGRCGDNIVGIVIFVAGALSSFRTVLTSTSLATRVDCCTGLATEWHEGTNNRWKTQYKSHDFRGHVRHRYNLSRGLRRGRLIEDGHGKSLARVTRLITGIGTHAFRSCYQILEIIYLRYSLSRRTVPGAWRSSRCDRRPTD